MSKLRRAIMQAASGAAAGGATYVDDVFSTYLYEGTGTSATATSTSSALGSGFTHNIQFSSDGLYVATHLPDNAVYIWSLSAPYNASTITSSTNFSFTAQTTNSQSSRLSDDGTKAYVSDGDTDVIFQYDLSTAYDASSASYASKSLDISGQVTNPRGFFFKPDGKSLFIVCANNDAIYQYTLSTAWDLSTGSYASKSVSSGGETNPYNVFFNDTGTVMIICGSANGLTEFALSTAWDISTASATGTTGNPDTYGTTTLSFAADFADNGSRLVVIDSGQQIGVGDLTTPYDIDTIGDGQVIRNDIDLDGEGGMVWIKSRGSATFGDHRIYDTERGATYSLASNQTWDNTQLTTGLTSFNSDGFTHGSQDRGNQSGIDYASWTFRKQPGFFDVVTYTGNGTAGTEIAHNLGSTPGMIIFKRYDSALNWYVAHRYDLSKYLVLNQTAAAGSFAVVTATSDTTFTLPNDGSTNASGGSYVAYLFAHDAQDFGTDSDESIVYCGTYEGNGSTKAVTLGWEPQWCLIKNIDDSSNDWQMFDTMRGAPYKGDTQFLNANDDDADAVGGGLGSVKWYPTSTGFEVEVGGGGANDPNENNETYIYVAIRRPHKPASEFAATDLFAVAEQTGASGDTPAFISGFPVDWAMEMGITGGNTKVGSRLAQGTYLITNSTAAESSEADHQFDYMTGYNSNGGASSNDIAWMFRRAPGFFDVVTYTGDGNNPRYVNHNLDVIPRMIWLKRTDSADDWFVWALKEDDSEAYISQSASISFGLNNDREVNTNTTYAPALSLATSTTFRPRQIPGGTNDTNLSGATYIAYLFGSVDGISKIGTYTGTGANVDVNCGFTSGARFVLVKRTDSTGDWYVWDSERGIVAGNDPYILLNLTSAQVTSTDYIDPLSSGFTITSSAPAVLNASGGNYIFLAIA